MAILAPDAPVQRRGSCFYVDYTSADMSVDWETDWYDFPGYGMRVGICRVQNPNGTGDNRLTFQQKTIGASAEAAGLGPGDGVVDAGRHLVVGGYIDATTLSLPVDGYYTPLWSSNQQGYGMLAGAALEPVRMIWDAASDATIGSAHFRFCFFPMVSLR